MATNVDKTSPSKDVCVRKFNNGLVDMKEVLPRYAPGKRNYRESPSKRRRLQNSQKEDTEKFWQNYQVTAKENTPPPEEQPYFRLKTETVAFSSSSEKSHGNPTLPRSIDQQFLPNIPKKENNIPDISPENEFNQSLSADREIYLDPMELSVDSVLPSHSKSGTNMTKGACFNELSEYNQDMSMTEELMEQDMLTRIIDHSPRKNLPERTKTTFLSLLCCILPNDDHVLTNVYRHKK
ncbi:uncharacterized protein LOC133202908 [Saccostrea echinata]|uniref:uncharacterized protein LOC133202908 n=1 Tax=Saccostrea echinata TaxID=191078 RepID=UPI002A80E735|nr:uncharacterized protein LOC133202908 [Saccostrea echinata]